MKREKSNGKVLLTTAIAAFAALTGAAHADAHRRPSRLHVVVQVSQEGVAAAQELYDQAELGVGGFGAAGGVDVDVVPVDAGPQERGDRFHRKPH